MSESDYPLPPPTFEFLVFSLKAQAEMQLGLYGFSPDDKDAGPNLPAARHAIDLLSMIGEKTRGNLSLEEQRLVENGLTELRFRYVQVMEQAKTEPAKTEPAKTEPAKTEPAKTDDAATGQAKSAAAADGESPAGEPAAGS